LIGLIFDIVTKVANIVSGKKSRRAKKHRSGKNRGKIGKHRQYIGKLKPPKNPFFRSSDFFQKNRDKSPKNQAYFFPRFFGDLSFST